jgi:hypothetical protein
MVSVGEDSMISFGGHWENRGPNLMGNKYIICTFSLIAMPPVSPPVMINVKQCMVHEIFFVFQWWHRKKFGNHCLKLLAILLLVLHQIIIEHR